MEKLKDWPKFVVLTCRTVTNLSVGKITGKSIKLGAEEGDGTVSR